LKLNNPTLNWTSPVNYKVKYPDPLPQTTATLEVSPEPVQFITQSSQVVRQWLLDKLQEESAEVIQAISKVRRFGEQNHHPDRSTTNHEELITELTDWLAIVAALEHLQYFDLQKEQQTILKKTKALIS
jgi:NTP pyrophosphatase (non-canonical NTP hydrolase)